MLAIPPTRDRRLPALLALTVSLGLLAGCQTAAPHGTAGPLPASNAELVNYLADQPYVTAEPAYRAVYALAKGAPFDGAFDALSTAMEQDNLASPHWHYAPDRRLRRSDVGYLVCRAAHVRTGVNWNLTGLGRYAWRELVWHGIAQGGSELNFMSGGEFVGVLSRADDYMTRHGKAGAMRVPLGEEPR